MFYLSLLWLQYNNTYKGLKMKLTNNLLNFILFLMLLFNNSYAKESCKGGFCIISLDSLDKAEKIKRVKLPIKSSSKIKDISKKVDQK